MNQQNDINRIDMFAVFTGIIQIMSYIELLNDNTNSELMEELQRQDSYYLSKIIAQNEIQIKQNEEILSLLKGGNLHKSE